ncbi:RNA-binding protein [Mycena sanguinolenta]|uniref:RNA-binding protein n=1 Tax=Mycena sanguinolenta TaxID=230812 RepID=A0A8H6X7G1_9AGAR|nr:RNA-binding protein [Mycena sanguinolenta]
MMLDEQLDQEMHNVMRNLPTSDDDKYNSFAGNKIPTSSAALDLAHILRRLCVPPSLHVLSRLATSRRNGPSSPDPDGPRLMIGC